MPGKGRGRQLLWMVFFSMLLAGCQFSHPLTEPAEPSAPTANPTNDAAVWPTPDNGGYALLFDLLGDEKDVAKIRFIKHPRPAMTELLKEISRTSNEAYKQLEAFGKSDRSLNLKAMHLPMGEVNARKAISKQKEKMLLSSKGKELEIQLLLTQQEAMNYGAHLADTLTLKEREPQRKQYLGHLGGQLADLERKLVTFLSQNYSFPEQK